MNQLNTHFYTMSEISILTSFQCWPFSPLETNILELNTCLIENQTGQLSTTTEVEVMKFVSRHFGLQRENEINFKFQLGNYYGCQNCAVAEKPSAVKNS
jgi:hypothetical protein